MKDIRVGHTYKSIINPVPFYVLLQDHGRYFLCTEEGNKFGPYSENYFLDCNVEAPNYGEDGVLYFAGDPLFYHYPKCLACKECILKR